MNNFNAPSSRLLMVVLLAVASTASPASAKQDPCFDESQTQLLCRYFVRNMGRAFRSLGNDVLSFIRNGKSVNACTMSSFKRFPELWDNLKVTRGRQYPSAKNQLMIFNTPEGLQPVIEKTKGVCWGNATMKFYLTRLAFFDPQAKFEALPSHPPGSPEWVQFYVEKIQQLTTGEPAIIPGFANLRDFSSHPALRDWFVRRQVELWAERAAHLKNLIFRADQRDMTSEQGFQFVKDVEERLAQGYTPKIMFDENGHKAVEGEEDSIHVVLAVGVHKLKNDKTAIVVWDDKRPYPDALDVLVINHYGGEDGKHAYGFFWSWRWNSWDNKIGKGNGIDLGGGRVNQFRIAPENDLEAMKMTLNLARFCEENPLACAELGDGRIRRVPKPKLPVPGKPWNNFEYLDSPSS